MVKNKDFRLLSIQGIYDLACPYLSMKYSLDHMALPSDYRANITRVLVPSGHMAYADRVALDQMNGAFVRFINSAAPAPMVR
jgi:carboxypeptidase C (cathepsin A)